MEMIPEVLPKTSPNPAGRWKDGTKEDQAAKNKKKAEQLSIGRLSKNSETAAQKEAFELYYSLKERSYVKVAEVMKVTVNTIQNWASKWMWQDRVKEREIIDDKQRMIEPLTVTVKAKQDVLKMLRLTIDKYVTRDETGEITAIIGLSLSDVKHLKTLVEAYNEVLVDKHVQAGAAPKVPLGNTQVNILIKR